MTDLPDAVRKLVDGPNFAHLATVLPNGGPHSVPLRVGLGDNRIAFLTSPGSRKARNIERDPRVAISITDHTQPFAMAQIRGRVTERLEGDVAWAIIDRISHIAWANKTPRLDGSSQIDNGTPCAWSASGVLGVDANPKPRAHFRRRDASAAAT